jgi:AraC family transcriptional regulator of adaptative response/methylated-DNA-[protein]-cysteine methyltransferase
MTYQTDEDRWAAIEARDRGAEGAFFCAVKTTGVYCLPSCSGRPLRKNVTFYDTADEALAAGYRACKRCKPDAQRESLRWGTVATDLGLALVAVSETGVRIIGLGDDEAELAADLARRVPKGRLTKDAAGLAPTLATVMALVEHPEQAADLPLDEQGSDLQRAVWKALRDIPAGRTASYAEVARAVGRPTAFRAVAQACGANPLAVVTPCHRVVGSDGRLSGYRWGVQRKAALLQREATA